MNPRTLAPLAMSAILVAGLAACGNDDAATPAAAPASASATQGGGQNAAASGSVTAQDQTSDGTTLTVAQVDLKGIDQGFIGVHMDLDGKPGPVVGVAQVKKGSTKDLVVRFDKPATTGAFWPMLHVDNGVVGTYEFPKVKDADLPVKDDEKIVMKKITLTVS